jgi:hypothetical protein
MEFGVIHEITNPDAWQKALESDPSWPDEFALLSFVEAEDKRRAMCIWRAPSQAVLQERLDQNLGRGAVNQVFPVVLHHFRDPAD